MLSHMNQIVFGLTMVSCLVACAMANAELKEGDTIPKGKLPGSDGKEYQLQDFVGKQAVVIAWYPKAFTGG